jgi:hypothetical protein
MHIEHISIEKKSLILYLDITKRLQEIFYNTEDQKAVVLFILIFLKAVTKRVALN